MLDGIAYRNAIMMKSIEDGKQWSVDFLADEMARKAVDSNALMPVYVELLLAKKRNPGLNMYIGSLNTLLLIRLKCITSTLRCFLLSLQILNSWRSL